MNKPSTTAFISNLPLLLLNLLALMVLLMHHPYYRRPAIYPHAYQPDRLTFKDLTIRRLGPANSTCTIVGCHTPGYKTEPFWKYYTSSGYPVALYSYTQVLHDGTPVGPTWCDVPTVRSELLRDPTSRVLYVDMDTKVDAVWWCNLPESASAPILMNTVFRSQAEPWPEFTIHGAQIQSNAFRINSGMPGLNAIKRWDNAFWKGSHADQGVIHRLEEQAGVCGVPGWVACVKNPYQNRCHCTGLGAGEDKDSCMEKLFNGTRERCPF